MRLCRYEHDGTTRVGIFRDDTILPLHATAESQGIPLPESACLLEYLPGGASFDAVEDLQHRIESRLAEETDKLALDAAQDGAAAAQPSRAAGAVRLLVPIPNPPKLMLLAGNYSAHIEEGGGRAEERDRTFPYVFMKPPSTTLTHPGAPVRIPRVSPNNIDWELELGVIIGKRCRAVSEADALGYVAGYTVVNDISDRKFKPNPGRAQRDKDGYFDWLHGKWHDTFCPMGPCVLPSSDVADPQKLKMTLRVNGHVEQDASTADMVFPVAAVIEFISSFVTLEPGDVISTGTPSGVGASKGKFLKPGDMLEAEIQHIGVLRNPVVEAE
jgi:2-keto-4-pentenoate hydratase/2-oxohepta-3-ene-1,7-dioic acid hydratase in catechol pathway